MTKTKFANGSRNKLRGTKSTHFRVAIKGGDVIWNLNASCRRSIRPVAAKFGLSPESFLERLTRSELPGQPLGRFSSGSAENIEMPPDFIPPNCSNRDAWRRIERAARFSNQSVALFIWEAVMGSVAGCENDMIVDPGNEDRCAGDEMDFEHFRVGFEKRTVAA